MSQTTDLQTIRNGVKGAKLPANMRASALWFMDKLPDLYQKLAKTCESRFFDEIRLNVQGMLKAIEVPSSIATVTDNFRAMHERHGIPTLGLKLPVEAAAKRTRAKTAAATASV